MVLSDIDRTLLARCLEGADGAWEDFVDRYIALITHVVTEVARVRMNSDGDPWRDDVVAEVFFCLVDDDYAVLRRFRGQSSLGTYLVVVSRRIASRAFSKIRHPTTGSLASNVDPAGSAPAIELAVESEEELRTMLLRMPESEATAIRMFHLEHRSYSDIGLTIGIPVNSVGPLLSKARERMRSMRP